MKPGWLVVYVLIIIVAVLAGILIGAQYAETPLVQSIKGATNAQAFEVDKKNFVPAKIGINDATVSLSQGCYEISFDVTEDQAFSIQHGLSKEMATRPLTHDILKDVLEEFNITIVQIRIERFGDEIYYARAFVQQGGHVLDLDMRPSDAIALSLRTGDTLYINQTMLQEHGTYTC
jgi:hypothetical protein